MNDALGTLPWTRATQGRLAPLESRRLLFDLLKAQLTLIPEEWTYKLGLKRPRDLTTDFDALAPPDTDAAHAARTACEAVAPPYLVNHSERSYWWGRILGDLVGLAPDPELLYAAAMFHDLGLTQNVGGTDHRPDCFTLLSAAQAETSLRELGWNSDRIDTVCEAITLHVNVKVDLAHGPEAHLLNQATALDTTGLRLWRVPAPARDAVLQRHSRLDMNAAICACWKAEADRFPDSRAGWLDRFAQLSKRMYNAPFPTP